MKLLLDIGNSRLRWAHWGEGRFSHGGVLTHAGRFETALEKALLDVPVPREVWVVSVAGPRAEEALTVVCQRLWQLAPRTVVAEARTGALVNGYREPEHLGADRWAALVGARALFGGPVCVADCGTALTIDLLDRGGLHRGGLILPGLTLMRRSLERGTQGVRVQVQAQRQGDDGLLGRSTAEAVLGGTLYAAVALIDRVIADVGVELGGAPVCVLTGGDAELLAPLFAVPARHEPDLTLKGLAVLAGAPADCL